MNILRQSKSILILTALALITFNTNSLTIDFDKLPNPDEIRKQVRADIAWLNDHFDRKDAELARKDQALRKAQREIKLLKEQAELHQTEMLRLRERIADKKDAENIFRRATQLFVEAGGSLVQISTNMRPFVEKALSNIYNISRLKEEAKEGLITNVLSSHLPPIGSTVATEVELLAQFAKGERLLAQRSKSAASSVGLAASGSADTSVFDLGSEGEDEDPKSLKKSPKAERSTFAELSEIQSSVFDLGSSSQAGGLNDSIGLVSFDDDKFTSSPLSPHLNLQAPEKNKKADTQRATQSVTKPAPSSPLRPKNPPATARSAAATVEKPGTAMQQAPGAENITI